MLRRIFLADGMPCRNGFMCAPQALEALSEFDNLRHALRGGYYWL